MRSYFAKFIVALVSITMLVIPASAAAYNPFGSVCTSASSQSAVCSSKDTANPISGSDGLLLKITNLVALLAGIAAVIVIIIGGLRFITANGQADSIKGARNTIIYALLGIVVIVSARIIIGFVLTKI